MQKKFEPHDLAHVPEKLSRALKSVDVAYLPPNEFYVDGPAYSIHLIVATKAGYTDFRVDSMQGDNLTLDNLYYALQDAVAYLATVYHDPDIDKAFFDDWEEY